MHTLILGVTESGKTTLAKALVQRYRVRGVPALVLDPLSDTWATEHVFADPDHFLAVVRASRCCAVFVDEAAEAVGHWDKHRHWLATRSRHYGHNVHFISQRGVQIAPTVRDQTSALALFRISLEDAATLARDWARPELVRAAQLLQFEFLWVTRFGECRKLRILPGGVSEIPHNTLQDTPAVLVNSS